MSNLIFTRAPRKLKSWFGSTQSEGRNFSVFSRSSQDLQEKQKPWRFILHRGHLLEKRSHLISTLNLTKWDFGFTSPDRGESPERNLRSPSVEPEKSWPLDSTQDVEHDQISIEDVQYGDADRQDPEQLIGMAV